jgi:CBS domain-containing protein
MDNIKKSKIGEYGNTITEWGNPDTDLLTISKKMEEKKIRHYPIKNQDKFIGIITDREIKLIAGWQRAEETMAKDIINKKDLYVVTPDTPFHQVLARMIEKKIGATIIDGEKEAKIFTTHDAMKILWKLAEH